MAIMIPSESYFEPKSGEKEMYYALKKLPDDYFVFHSFKVINLLNNGSLNENEIDFIIYHHSYGAIFLECKNSVMKRINGEWYYGSDIPCKDPFAQAYSGQYSLLEALEREFKDEKFVKEKYLIKNFKCIVSVWFPKMTRTEIERENFGPIIDKRFIMSKDELNDITKLKSFIDNIFSQINKVHFVFSLKEIKQDSPHYKMNLTKAESEIFLNKILCPTLGSTIDIKKEKEQLYKNLLKEQFCVLEYLKYQNTVAISGDSGTGKTLIALERAKQLSMKKQKVLFLCYNVNLKESLKSDYSKQYPNIYFYTLDALCVEKCNTDIDHINYYDLKSILENEMINDRFEFNHIIVDEGQDFGQENIDDSSILELFYTYAKDDANKSFYIFYDKNQLVNSNKIPKYLSDVDSKLTLYKNCRNTKSIAKTAFSLINKEPILNDNALEGDKTKFINYSNSEDFYLKLDSLISKLVPTNEKRVIISCSKGLEKSEIYSKIKTSKGISQNYKTKNYKTPVYTSSKYKGLESDNVIVIDVNNDTFNEDNKRFYVACSRAKYNLYVFINENNLNMEKIIDNRFSNKIKYPNKLMTIISNMGGKL